MRGIRFWGRVAAGGSAAALLVVGVRAGDELGAGLAIVGALVLVLLAWRAITLVRDMAAARERLVSNERRLAALVEHASDAVSISDADGRPLYVSKRAEQLLGRPVPDVVGVDAFALVHPDDREAALSAFREAAARPGATTVSVARVRHADGTWRWIESVATNRLDDPSVGGMVTNFRDVTERRRAEAIEVGATRTLESIIHGTPPAITLEDLVATIDEHLDRWRCTIELFDPERDERLATISAGPGPNPRTARWVVAITTQRSGVNVGLVIVHGDTDVSPTPGEVALVERAAALAAVVIDRAMAEDRLEHQAFHDLVTGLPNRTLLMDRLGQAVLRLARDERGVVAVMFLDLDRFKVINDSLGHDAGDELLLAVSRRLVDALQAADTVARFGGDEFVVVYERVGGAADAHAVAERLLAAFDEPFTLTHGGPVALSASIGIALARNAHYRPEALLRDADAAMNRAKARGGNRVEVFDSTLRSSVVVRLDTERALRHALQNDELRVRYQPVLRLADGQRVGTEALLRWRHPLRGLITPADFIDVAEETGLIVPLGEWVLIQALEQLQRLQLDQTMRALTIAVNLSGRQLSQTDLVETVDRHLVAHGVDPSCLVLEVTESVLLDDIDSSSSALSGLKDLGVRLAVDDFGTGYSSLGYLKKFPFDMLKLDQAFTAGLGASAADDAIVFATAQMAHALGMIVVAEGVETLEQHERARELGCDLAQGYLYAPPGKAEDVFGPARGLEAVP